MNRISLLVFSIVAIFLLSGCATGRKKTDLEMQGLKNQISLLETQVQTKDEEINSLKDSLNRAQEEKMIEGQNINKKNISPRVKDRPNLKQIQTSLKNAGYNPGAIDGRMGTQTKEAIRSFQKDSGLHIDGKVGKKTWQALRKYLYQKVK